MRGHSAQAETRDRSGAGFGAHPECSENLVGCRCLVMEPEDEKAWLDFFCRDQGEAAGVAPKLHLRGSCRLHCEIGQRARKRRVACMIEGCTPIVEQMARRAVGNEPYLLAPARKPNDDGGVNGT